MNQPKNIHAATCINRLRGYAPDWGTLTVMRIGKFMKTFRSVVLLLFILFSFSVMAEKDGSRNIKEHVEIISHLKEKNIRLDEQNKILLTTGKELRSSYYWSLGFSATFLLLFLGVNIYFFRSRYSEDKEYLLSHIEINLNKSVVKVQDEISKDIHGLESKINKIASEKVNNSLSAMNSKINLIRDNVQENKMDVIDLEIQIETNKKTSGNGNLLSLYFRQVQLIVGIKKSGWDWKISDTLEEMAKLLEDGTEFDSMELPEVMSILNDLPSKFDASVHKMKNKLKS